MIGVLPENLTVCGKALPINSDYRIALLIFEALDDPDLSQHEKTAIMINCLYEEPEKIPFTDYKEACEQAAWFLDGGKEYEKSVQSKEIVISWSQDEQMIFSAVNKVAGYEVRQSEFLHWWSFLGCFSEIGDSLLSTVLSIRKKKAKKQKLDKSEQEFYQKNRDLIDIKNKYSAAEQAERDRLNALLG